MVNIAVAAHQGKTYSAPLKEHLPAKVPLFSVRNDQTAVASRYRKYREIITSDNGHPPAAYVQRRNLKSPKRTVIFA